MDSLFSVCVLGMFLQQIHDLIVKLFRGLLVTGHPVVDLPVIGGQVDEAVILAKQIDVQLTEKKVCKFNKLQWGSHQA